MQREYGERRAACGNREGAWKLVWIRALKLNLFSLLARANSGSVTGRREGKLARTRTSPSVVCRDFDSKPQKVKWVLSVREGRVVRRAPAPLNKHLHQTKPRQGGPGFFLLSRYLPTYLSILLTNNKVG